VGHVLQGRYKAILVDRVAYLLELCRYVVLNPVRARLVEDPAEWPWCAPRTGLGGGGAPYIDLSFEALGCRAGLASLELAKRASLALPRKTSGWRRGECGQHLGDFCQRTYHLACLFVRLLCRDNSYIARLCACYRFLKTNENPAQSGTFFSGNRLNADIAFY
jgi:hypothetical protein